MQRKCNTLLYEYRQNIWILTDIYKDIAENVETRSNRSNFEIDRPISKGKNKKVIRLMKNELGGQIVREFIRWRGKTYIYLKDKNEKYKKSKTHTKGIQMADKREKTHKSHHDDATKLKFGT